MTDLHSQSAMTATAEVCQVAERPSSRTRSGNSPTLGNSHILRDLRSKAWRSGLERDYPLSQ
jgi:hypothetical protein